MVKKNCPLFNGVKGTSRVDLFTEFFFLTEASFSPNPAIYTHREKKAQIEDRIPDREGD
jgi:hypothetical protein